MRMKFIFALILATNAFAQAKQTPPFEQGLSLPDGKYPNAVNAPARIKVQDSCDFDIDASFIYWHVSQEYMDIGDQYEDVGMNGLGEPTYVPFTTTYQPVEYKPGFKVGAGWKTTYDSWSFLAEYTRLHQKTAFSQTLASPNIWILPNWFDLFDLNQLRLGPDGISYKPTVLQSSWKMHFDLLDLLASRPFYQSPAISILPYAGLRGLLITQSISIQADPNEADYATSNNHSHCWAVGPNAGVQGHWMFPYGLRFEGNLSGSLLYTRYTKLSTRQTSSDTANGALVPLDFTAATRNYNALRPNFEFGVGLGWQTYSTCQKYSFDLSARYDFLQFWSQNMMRYWVTNLFAAPSAVGDLQFHGLTLTATLDF